MSPNEDAATLEHRDLDAGQWSNPRMDVVVTETGLTSWGSGSG